MNIKFTLSVTLLALLVGCGGAKSDRKMETSEKYTVTSGDKIVRNEENTLLKITHTSGDKKSTVELLEGDATIIYKK